jgi:hypothetical protein
MRPMPGLFIFGLLLRGSPVCMLSNDLPQAGIICALQMYRVSVQMVTG